MKELNQEVLLRLCKLIYGSDQLQLNNEILAIAIHFDTINYEIAQSYQTTFS